jgi:hypothetical protein
VPDGMHTPGHQDGAQFIGCDLERLFGVGGARGVVELDGAVLIGFVAITCVAIAGELHAHGGGGCERDKDASVTEGEGQSGEEEDGCSFNSG